MARLTWDLAHAEAAMLARGMGVDLFDGLTRAILEADACEIDRRADSARFDAGWLNTRMWGISEWEREDWRNAARAVANLEVGLIAHKRRTAYPYKRKSYTELKEYDAQMKRLARPAPPPEIPYIPRPWALVLMEQDDA